MFHVHLLVIVITSNLLVCEIWSSHSGDWC